MYIQGTYIIGGRFWWFSFLGKDPGAEQSGIPIGTRLRSVCSQIEGFELFEDKYLGIIAEQREVWSSREEAWLSTSLSQAVQRENEFFLGFLQKQKSICLA